MRNFTARALALASLVVLATCTADPAFAQTVALGPAVESFWQSTVQPIAFAAASGAVTALLAWIAVVFQKKTGFELDAKARETLHSAAMTGVNLALSKTGSSLAAMTPELKSGVVADAIEHVLTDGAPDAVKRLGLTTDVVASVVASKLSALTNASATVGVTTTPPAAGG